MNPVQGWYPDPENATQLRWWDGEAWSEHVREHPQAQTGAQEAEGVEIAGQSSDAVQDIEPSAQAFEHFSVSESDVSGSTEEVEVDSSFSEDELLDADLEDLQPTHAQSAAGAHVEQVQQPEATYEPKVAAIPATTTFPSLQRAALSVVVAHGIALASALGLILVFGVALASSTPTQTIGGAFRDQSAGLFLTAFTGLLIVGGTIAVNTWSLRWSFARFAKLDLSYEQSARCIVLAILATAVVQFLLAFLGLPGLLVVLGAAVTAVYVPIAVSKRLLAA